MQKFKYSNKVVVVVVVVVIFVAIVVVQRSSCFCDIFLCFRLGFNLKRKVDHYFPFYAAC